VRDCNNILALPVEALFEADEAVVADDEVIDQFDVELLAGLHELLGDGDVFRQGRRVAVGWLWQIIMSGLSELTAGR
jgi:hypothetical protein